MCNTRASKTCVLALLRPAIAKDSALSGNSISKATIKAEAEQQYIVMAAAPGPMRVGIYVNVGGHFGKATLVCFLLIPTFVVVLNRTTRQHDRQFICQ